MSTETISEIREGDVFRFRWSDAELAKRTMPYHCFDGLLVAIKEGDELTLYDTFWLYDMTKGAGDARRFAPDRVRELGELTFVCNLDGVKEISKGEALYYDDADVFNLTRHHGYRGCLALRNGAEKSPAKMRSVLDKQIEEARHEISWAQSKLERLAEYVAKVEAGDLSGVYL